MGGLIRSSLGVLSPKINQRTTMKAVFALLLVCLIQISFAEEQESIGSEGNLLLQREARDAAKGKTQRCPDGMSRRECKKLKKKSKRMKKNRQRNPKKGGKGRKGQRTAKGEPKRKRPGKGRPKKKEEKGKGKNRKKSQSKGLNEAGSSSGRSGSGRQDTCFTDMVAKTKKFNKAQVEFRLTKRIETWGKLMKNKKNNSASTFSDALEAMNEATGNGKSCEGDSSSLAEAKKVQEKLANCSVSAGANCDEGKLSVPISSTLVSSVKLLWRPLLKTLRPASPSQMMLKYVPVYKASPIPVTNVWTSKPCMTV